MPPSLGDFCFFVDAPGGAELSGPFDEQTVRNVMQAIRFAWDRIHTSLRTLPANLRPKPANENAFNGLLCQGLNDILDGDELAYFPSTQFQNVVQEAKQRSPRHRLAPRMPDLQVAVFRTGKTGVARSKAILAIECKLLTTTEHIREYVVNGMHRFVRGDYAPHVSVGMMLAYAAWHHKLPGSLERYLRRAHRREAKSCRASFEPFDDARSACYVSRHRRSSVSPANRINLLHLWLPHPWAVAAPRSTARRKLPRAKG